MTLGADPRLVSNRTIQVTKLHEVRRMKRAVLLLLSCALISGSAMAQGSANFRTALQRGNAADPQLIPFLSEQFKPLAQRLLPNHTVSRVTIDRATGAVQVTATDRSGKVISLDGSKVGGNPGESAAVFGWITCAWNWFTSLGANGCPDAQADVPMTDVPEHWNRQQERDKNRAFLDMTQGG